MLVLCQTCALSGSQEGSPQRWTALAAEVANSNDQVSGLEAAGAIAGQHGMTYCSTVHMGLQMQNAPLLWTVGYPCPSP